MFNRLGTFIYAPLAMVSRSLIISSGYHISVSNLIDFLIRGVGYLDISNNIGMYINSIFTRMALLDWLAAFIHFGREVFNTQINLNSLFINIVNQFAPGQLIQSDYMDITQFINLIWRGWSTEVHGELAGIYGALYLYFGYIGGVVAFAVWFWFSSYLVRKLNFLFLVVYLTAFVNEFMTGGIIASSVRGVVDYTTAIIIIFFVMRVLEIVSKSLKQYKLITT